MSDPPLHNSVRFAKLIKDTDKQIEGLLDKPVESESPTVRKALGKRVEKPETEKPLLA